MVGVLKRMTQLKTLLSIRLGPGAAKLPPEVTRIHLDFGIKTTDGHGGAAKFLRQTLPRLKYHNPSLPITVNRTKDQEGPAILTVHFTTPDAASSAPQISSTTSSTTSTGPIAQTTPAAPVVRTETIHMKHRHQSEILQQVMAITKATVVLPTPEEEAEMEELKRKRIESEKVSLKSRQATEARKRAEAVVLQARNATTAASAAAV